MSIIIKKLDEIHEIEYETMVLSIPNSLIYYSLKFRNFLRKVLINAEDYYLLAYENGKLTAAMPTFIMRSPFGNIANSMPFYGSNGSVIATSDASQESKELILDYYKKVCINENVIISTIIENPFHNNADMLNNYQADYYDNRIGQLTCFPTGVTTTNIEKILLDTFHYKTRNAIRKGEKSDLIYNHDGSIDTMRKLFLLHNNNIRAIGGKPKEWNVFINIYETFIYDEDYRVYYAKNCSDQIVAALLVFFYNYTVEYFTPAVQKEYRSMQPLSYLIFIAMQDAIIRNNCKWWNWGGTWVSQESLYRFKSRWGTLNTPYRYHIKEHKGKDILLKYSDHELLKAYPYFYTLPFSILSNNQDY